MFERRLRHLVSGRDILGDEVMVKPEEIERMLEMRARGWGTKRIAAELGCARNTMRRYFAPWRSDSLRGRLVFPAITYGRKCREPIERRFDILLI